MGLDTTTAINFDIRLMERHPSICESIPIQTDFSVDPIAG